MFEQFTETERKASIEYIDALSIKFPLISLIKTIKELIHTKDNQELIVLKFFINVGTEEIESSACELARMCSLPYNFEIEVVTTIKEEI